MSVDIEYEICPTCGAHVDTIAFHYGIREDSSIGPPATPCSGCGELLATGKSEWVDKTALQKCFYVAKLTVYAAAGSVMIGMALGLLLAFILAECGVLEEDQLFDTAWAIAGVIVVCLACLAVRNARRDIGASLRRTNPKDQGPTNG